MLTLSLPENEVFDEKNSKVIFIPGQEIRMEHSLIALSNFINSLRKLIN